MYVPDPQGKEVDNHRFVDSDNVGDKVSHRSRSGFMIYANTALVQWYSKKLSTVETSVIGAEFIAMRQGVDSLQYLRYKLRMMGILLSVPSNIYEDNMAVIHNSFIPASVLRKKRNSVCYHTVQESIAMGGSLVQHILSKDYIADLLTKVLYW